MPKSIQDIFNSNNAVLTLFVVLAISLIFNTFKVIQRNYELQQQVDELAAEVALIDIQNQNLKFNIEYYKTDAFLEVEAKRRFNLAGSGEKVILLPKDGDPEESIPISPSITNDGGTIDDKSNFDKWMIFLFGSTN